MTIKKFDSTLYKPIIISIDGTAASGKGTVVKGLQNNLDKRYRTLDAGLMYRALTYFYINKKKIDNPEILEREGDLEERLNKEVKIKFSDKGLIILNDKEIEPLILRGPEIDPYVGKFSALDEVKNYIVNNQKKVIEESNYGWILDGRCMGTAVAPQAQVKFFMDAPLLVRATRRHFDYVRAEKGDYSTEEVAIDLENRDKMDYATNVAPLLKPEDAIEIDSFKYSPEAVVEKTLSRVYKKIVEAGKI